MVTMRVVRHDRHEQVLADCQTAVIPARGEVIQLDTTDASGEMTQAEHAVARRFGDRPRPVARVVAPGRRQPAVA